MRSAESELLHLETNAQSRGVSLMGGRTEEGVGRRARELALAL